MAIFLLDPKVLDESSRKPVNTSNIGGSNNPCINSDDKTSNDFINRIFNNSIKDIPCDTVNSVVINISNEFLDDTGNNTVSHPISVPDNYYIDDSLEFDSSKSDNHTTNLSVDSFVSDTNNKSLKNGIVKKVTFCESNEFFCYASPSREASNEV
jgi:hypothetical protein